MNENKKLKRYSVDNVEVDSNNNLNKIQKYDINNLYKKYLSQSNGEYESLIDEDPIKFLSKN